MRAMKPGQAEDRKDIELLGRYWVVPGKLLAGPYPAWTVEESTPDGLAGLAAIGVRQFIDLTHTGETDHPYSARLAEFSKKAGLSLSYTRIPIQDMGVPEIEQMNLILNRLDACVVQGMPVYLHCLGGLGRTGTVVGCYLVRHGMSGGQALQRLEFLRRNTSNRSRPSPETADQVRFILDWHAFDRSTAESHGSG